MKASVLLCVYNVMQESLTDGTGEKQKPKAEGRKTNWKAQKAPRWGERGARGGA